MSCDQIRIYEITDVLLIFPEIILCDEIKIMLNTPIQEKLAL